MSKSITYWWAKHQKLKEILSDYMKENNCKTVEEAIIKLLRENGEGDGH